MYNSKLDKEIKVWRITITNEQTAIVSLKSYDGGAPKIQIGPVEVNQDGKIIHSRFKRWGWGEALKLHKALGEAIEKMDSLAAKGRK